MKKEIKKELIKILENPKFQGYFLGIRFQNIDKVYNALKKIPNFVKTSNEQEVLKEIKKIKYTFNLQGNWWNKICSWREKLTKDL